MDNIQNNIIDILNVINNYIVYIYPGLISLIVYSFIQGKPFEENKNTIIKSVAISFLYIILLQELIVFKPGDISGRDIKAHLILILSAVIFPYVLVKITGLKITKSFIRKIGIKSNVKNNPLDIALEYEKSVYISAYLDDYNVMYAGWLRNHTSDINEAKYIMLSHYVVYRYLEELNKYVEVYPNNEIDVSLAAKKNMQFICDKVTNRAVEEVMRNEWERRKDSNESGYSAEKKGKKHAKANKKEETIEETMRSVAKIKDDIIKEVCEKSVEQQRVDGKGQDWVILEQSKITRYEIIFKEEH